MKGNRRVLFGILAEAYPRKKKFLKYFSGTGCACLWRFPREKLVAT